MTKTKLVFSILFLAVIENPIPVSAQAFLSPYTAQAPTMNANGAFDSGGATGDINHSSNLLTGAQAINAGVVGGRVYGLQAASTALVAPNSVDNTPLPSGTFGYGFAGSQSGPPSGIGFGVSVGVGTSSDGSGVGLGFNFDLGGIAPGCPTATYAGQPLPAVSTSSVDLNVVDCPFLRQNGGWSPSSSGINIGVPGLGVSVSAGGSGVGVQVGSGDPSVGSLQAYFGP
ncbi:MAG TPA: hypothetical protein V6C97_10100 [Oculatellaceae cyanobacterium]